MRTVRRRHARASAAIAQARVAKRPAWACLLLLQACIPTEVKIMRTVTSLLIAGSLAIGSAAACKKADDPDGKGTTTPKAVEESEKDVVEASKDVEDKRDDVADGKGSVREEKIELKEEKADFKKQRDEFVELAKKKMSELDTRVDALKADFKEHGSRLKADTREEMAEMVKKLEAKRADARASFDRAANASEAQWNDLERSTGEALDDLQASAQSLADKLDDEGIEQSDDVKVKMK
jgi:molecular chaperone GrpE (heat shock protein)